MNAQLAAFFLQLFSYWPTQPAPAPVVERQPVRVIKIPERPSKPVNPITAR